jgi:hypothetical protein
MKRKIINFRRIFGLCFQQQQNNNNNNNNNKNVIILNLSMSHPDSLNHLIEKCKKKMNYFKFFFSIYKFEEQEILTILIIIIIIII